MLMKVTTFNLRLNHVQDKENAWPYRLKSVLEYINTTKPLVLGAQEVLDDMLNDLKGNLPDYSFVGVTRKEREEANPIFYQHEILELKEYGTFWLSNTPDVPNSVDFDSACIRICTWAEFMFKNNRKLRFRVFNTHLDHISSLARLEGIKLIFKRINSFQTMLPTVLMGDFNATVNDEVIEYMKTQPMTTVYNYLNAEEYGTTFHYYSGITDGHPIDHIYLTKDINVLQVNIFKEKIFNIFLSDHYPVTALIEI